MSCLFFWCRRVHTTDSDTDWERKEERPMRCGKRRIQWRKDKKQKKTEEEEKITVQQPLNLENESNSLDLPVGLESGRPSAPAEVVVRTGPPVEDLTGQTEDDAEHLQKVLLDDKPEQSQRENEMNTTVGDEADAELTADLMSESVHSREDELLIATREIKKLLKIQLDQNQPEHLDGAQPTNTAEDDTEAEDHLVNTSACFDLSLVNKMMNMMATVLKAAEAKSDAIVNLLSLSIDLEDSVGATVETPLDKMLIASQAKREAIRELLKIQLDQNQPEHLDGAQPTNTAEDEAEAAEQLDHTLACFDRSLVNKVMRMMAKVVKAADAETDAILDLLSLSIGLGDRVETPLGKPAEAQAHGEQLDRVLFISGGSSTTLLEHEMLIASQEIKKLLNIQPDQNQPEHLAEAEVKLEGLPEETPEKNKRKTRQGTRGKGRGQRANDPKRTQSFRADDMRYNAVPRTNTIWSTAEREGLQQQGTSVKYQQTRGTHHWTRDQRADSDCSQRGSGRRVDSRI